MTKCFCCGSPDLLPVGEILNNPEHWAKIKELSISGVGPRLNLEGVHLFTGFCAQMGLQIPKCVDKL